ncbi:6870_t:CDS:1 [Dentiscutata heterogama]|uniref:6870_t:CDS:1 n=1 Tax=Dentiscutata heterogama TaxID=1316150 RepID=A0ACA9LM42_9GLOM|nr:6870_t:CDS:1 [Dentiscutata heterogama]
MIAYSQFVEPSQGRYDESLCPQTLNNNLNSSTFSCATSPLINDCENESSGNNFNNSRSLMIVTTGSDSEKELSRSTTTSTTTSTTASTTTSAGSENELPVKKKEFTEAKRVKNLLNLFPPPCTAEQFFNKNPPKEATGGDGRVKRPCNKFIIFRKVAHDQKKETSKLMNYNERTFSKYIGIIWKHLITPEEKGYYEKLADKVAEIHKIENPNYKYKPKRDKATWKQYSPDNQRKKKSRVQTTYSLTDNFGTNIQPIQSEQQLYYFEVPAEFNDQTQYFASNNISNNIQDNNHMQYYETYNENYTTYYG